MAKVPKELSPAAQIRKLEKENHMLKVTMGGMIAVWNNITQGEITGRCPICHGPYVFYPKIVGDQSACALCKRDARRVRA